MIARLAHSLFLRLAERGQPQVESRIRTPPPAPGTRAAGAADL